jgi:LysM repeat protein
MNIKLKKVAQISVLMSLLSLGNNTLQAVSCWKGACIVKQDDTLLQIAQEMEESAQAVAEGKRLEPPQELKTEKNIAVAEQSPQIEYEEDDLFYYGEEDDLLWQSDTNFDVPEYEINAEKSQKDNTAIASASKFSANKRTYTVEVGDTLFSVMRKNKVHWRVLAQLNNINPPYSLTVGQTIKLSSNKDSLSR